MADTRNRLPGYALIDVLDSDPAGSVWRGRDEASNEPVELRRLPGPADLLDRERARRAAASITAVQHPHLARTRRLIALPTGIVVVTDAFGGGSLAGLLAARGRLSAGEVVTTGGPLAAALAALHEAGLAHGRVTAAAVRFAPDGRPVLTDVALDLLATLPRRPLPGFGDPDRPPDAPPDPAGDVHDLAALCVAALTGKAPYAPDAPQLSTCAPPALADALIAALRALPERRCSAADLSAALLACPAEPVRLAGGRAGSAVPPVAARAGVPTGPGVDGDPVGQPRVRHGAHRGDSSTARAARPTRQRGPRVPSPLALVAALVIVLFAGGVLGHRWAPRDTGSAQPAAAAAGAAGATSTRAAAPAPVAPSAATNPSVATPAPAATSAREPSARSSTVPSSPAPSAHATASRRPAPDWPAVLASLDDRRAKAFATGDGVHLSAVYAPDAPALARDRALLHQLTARGAIARGLHSRVISARSTSTSEDRAVLRVTDLLGPYGLVGPDARVQQTVPGRGRVSWNVTLVRTADGWRVYDVQRRNETRAVR